MKKILPFFGILLGGGITTVGFFGIIISTIFFPEAQIGLDSIPFYFICVGVAAMMVNAVCLAVAAVFQQAKALRD